jgi:hypothetical protein
MVPDFAAPFTPLPEAAAPLVPPLAMPLNVRIIQLTLNMKLRAELSFKC